MEQALLRVNISREVPPNNHHRCTTHHKEEATRNKEEATHNKEEAIHHHNKATNQTEAFRR
ncbi:hypothetical protein M7I_1062 [Glarea lozoyensis 74030]|uniref:Uncharacterized protein n=1 Tax=Glarea lozoyensis (strain ATCC 74030 / MF5533) TaxID=1104152 RepID=H0EF24_GLAL7|nr:hypothetical protein M7I_1062 [Glarea lozoyensis 74030]